MFNNCQTYSDERQLKLMGKSSAEVTEVILPLLFLPLSSVGNFVYCRTMSKYLAQLNGVYFCSAANIKHSLLFPNSNASLNYIYPSLFFALHISLKIQKLLSKKTLFNKQARVIKLVLSPINEIRQYKFCY